VEYQQIVSTAERQAEVKAEGIEGRQRRILT